MVLIPRRQLRHLNSQLSASGTKDGVRDDAVVFLAEGDADRLGLADGKSVRVQGQHGSVVGRLRVDPSMREGTVAIPHGHEDLNVNVLTSSSEHVDDLTGMVTLSAVPVEVVATE